MQTRFKRLVEDHQNAIYNQAYSMLGSREEAEEATQDVFMRAYRGLSAFRGESKLSTWIYRITTNVCISRLRLKKPDIISLDESVADNGRPLAQLLADLMDTPDKQYERKQLARIMTEQVRRLPANWAKAINLHHFQGFSYTEISKIMKLPRPTVASFVIRGRQRLVKMLTSSLGKAEINSL